MNLMCLELSSAQGSMAVFKDGEIVASSEWIQERRGSQILFEKMPVLMTEAGLEWTDIDLYAMGRGPGNYSGLRIALSTLQALAAPDGTEVYTVSSGEALVYQIGPELNTPRVAVIGDARRERLWFGAFQKTEGAWGPEKFWQLVTPGELKEVCGSDCRIITPEWKRIEPILSPFVEALSEVEPRDYFPHAKAVGSLVLDRLKRDKPSEPCSPLYLHPAVA